MVKEIPVMMAVGLTASVPCFSQVNNNVIQNYKIADSDEITAKALSDLLGNPMLNVVKGRESYNFTAEQFLDYFINKEIASVVGQEEYASFLGERPYRSGSCKCLEVYSWINNEKVLMGVDIYSIGISSLVFNSGLNKMLNGILVQYNSLSETFEAIETNTKELERNLDNPGYKVLLTLCDYLSPKEIRAEKNRGSTCYILVDSYERAFLEKFIGEGMLEFLKSLDEKNKN